MSEILASAKVRCSGSMHTVVLFKDAENLDLPDHRDQPLGRLRALNILGGRCRCLEVYDAFAHHVVENLPRVFHPYLIPFPVSYVHLNDASSQHQLAVFEKAEQALRTCHYRRSLSLWAGGFHQVLIFTGHGHSSAYGRSIHKLRGRYHGTDSELSISLEDSWLDKVHAHGLATVVAVDGRTWFVLDVDETWSGRGARLLVAKQGEHVSVRERWAVWDGVRLVWQ